VLVTRRVEHRPVDVVLDGSSTQTGWFSRNGTSATTRWNSLISGTREPMKSRIFSNV
jgi:hypothetical protein